MNDESRLSPREREVLEMARNGLADKEIAVWLGIAPQTVKNHLHSCRKVIGSDNVKRRKGVIPGISRDRYD